MITLKNQEAIEEYRILLEAVRLERHRMWQINLLAILSSLIRKLDGSNIDFLKSGIALYYAAHIHRLKSELILKADVPSSPKPNPAEGLLLPPAIIPPIRSGYITTTLFELINALSKALTLQKKHVLQLQPQSQSPIVNIGDFVLKIEEALEDFIIYLKGLLTERGIIDLKELIRDVDRITAVRRFILLLFAVSKGEFKIYQNEDSGEIIVRLGGNEQA